MMFVELHVLQNFAPSNLNRDDTNSPKDCEFGGYRRARISSQAFKRAVRGEFAKRGLVPTENRAARTKRLADTLVSKLVAAGKDPESASTVVDTVIKGMGLDYADDSDPEAAKKTEYLLFLGEQEIASVVDLCLEHWDQLVKIAPAGAGGTAREAKKASKAALPKEVRNAFLGVLDGGKAADVALFGRMLADLPEQNIDAASQVAHAISTNRVSMEFDFYTAVDDLRPEDTAGADMLGTVEFNSACFYRYANVDLNQLNANLGEDEELARTTLEAFLRASISAIPTGKQNSMAAHNPPSFVLAVVRDSDLWSLANAFVKPVSPNYQGDLVENSLHALDTYWGQLDAMYGSDGVVGSWCVSLDGNGLKNLSDAQLGSFNQLVHNVLTSASFANNGTGGTA